MEEIIKENIIHYRGAGRPYISTAYGYLRLTKEKLILDYYLFGVPAIRRVYGILKRKIEIPIKNIREVNKFLDILIITYLKDSEIKKAYVGFWKAFKTGLYTLKLCDEWIREINDLKIQLMK